MHKLIGGYWQLYGSSGVENKLFSLCKSLGSSHKSLRKKPSNGLDNAQVWHYLRFKWGKPLEKVKQTPTPHCSSPFCLHFSDLQLPTQRFHTVNSAVWMQCSYIYRLKAYLILRTDFRTSLNNILGAVMCRGSDDQLHSIPGQRSFVYSPCSTRWWAWVFSWQHLWCGSFWKGSCLWLKKKEQRQKG